MSREKNSVAIEETTIFSRYFGNFTRDWAVKKVLGIFAMICWGAILFIESDDMGSIRLSVAVFTAIFGAIVFLLDLVPKGLSTWFNNKTSEFAQKGFIMANLVLAIQALYNFPEGLIMTAEFHKTLLLKTLYFAIVLFFFSVMLYAEKEQRILVEQTNVLLDEKLRNITDLNSVGTALSTILDLEKLLDLILDITARITKVEMVSLFLVVPDRKEVVLKNSRGLPLHLQGTLKIQYGDGIIGKVAQSGEPLLIKDIEQFDRNLARPSSTRYHTKSSVCVPLKVKDEVIGVLSVNNKKNRQPFTEADLEMTSLLAAQISVAIVNANLYQEMQKNFVSTIRALSAAIDAKDQYTSGHSSSVTKYVIPVAKELGYSRESLVRLEYAGLLHDIGKIGIIESILNKKGRLTDEEFEIIKGHPSIGANIIKSVDFLKDVMLVVKHHHERYDGRGYPDKLKGENIPIGSRIIAVADTFDAMTSDRPYRKGLPYKIAMEEIRKCSGSQFDPKVAEAFLRVYERNELPLTRKED